MTRARLTLALLRFGGSRGGLWPDSVREPEAPAYAGRSHPLPHAFPANGAVLYRSAVPVPQESPALARRYLRPGLGEINLGFAGRRPAGHRVHRAIGALSPGDPLAVQVDEWGRWELRDGDGTVVGHLARGFEPPAGARCRSGTVRAIVTWSRGVSEPGYQDGLECDTWEVVVPELVFD